MITVLVVVALVCLILGLTVEALKILLLAALIAFIFALASGFSNRY